MLLELRTYDFAPGRALDYLKLFSTEGLPLITRHLPMAGYWLTEVGALNRIRHAWIYQDFAERTARRAKFMDDKEWTQGFLPRGMALIARQECQLLDISHTSAAVQSILEKAGGEIAPLAAGAPFLAEGWISLRDDVETGDLSGRIVVGEQRGERFTFTREDDPVARGATEILRPCTFSPV